MAENKPAKPPAPETKAKEQTKVVKARSNKIKHKAVKGHIYIQQSNKNANSDQQSVEKAEDNKLYEYLDSASLDTEEDVLRMINGTPTQGLNSNSRKKLMLDQQRKDHSEKLQIGGKESASINLKNPNRRSSGLPMQSQDRYEKDDPLPYIRPFECLDETGYTKQDQEVAQQVAQARAGPGVPLPYGYNQMMDLRSYEQFRLMGEMMNSMLMFQK